jgi:hypothetical protein
MAVRVTVQSQVLRFGASWCTTEKDLQEPYLSRPFVDVAVVVLLFVRSGETTPLFHGRSSYGAATDAFKYKLRFR